MRTFIGGWRDGCTGTSLPLWCEHIGPILHDEGLKSRGTGELPGRLKARPRRRPRTLLRMAAIGRYRVAGTMVLSRMSLTYSMGRTEGVGFPVLYYQEWKKRY